MRTQVSILHILRLVYRNKNDTSCVTFFFLPWSDSPQPHSTHREGIEVENIKKTITRILTRTLRTENNRETPYFRTWISFTGTKSVICREGKICHIYIYTTSSSECLLMIYPFFFQILPHRTQSYLEAFQIHTHESTVTIFNDIKNFN